MQRKHNYKELDVWKLSRLFVTKIYTATKEFPKEELFGLTQQMRRAAISIPSNIAEGFGRGTNPQIVHFLNISQGSAFEIETQIYLSLDLAYLNSEKSDELLQDLDRIKKMIEALQKAYDR
jgi:four helix bundle protein